MAKTKVAILISGRGSNMRSLIQACEAEDYPAEVSVVISNKPDAGGLDYASAANIPCEVVNHREFDSRWSFDAKLDEVIRSYDVDMVCLAGFMRLLTPGFVEKWTDKMLNIHPSLLPSFKGAHAHEDAIAAGVKVTGCTVHFVIPEMDAGPIIAQAVVPVSPEDNALTLSERVLKAEHQCYPMALKLVAGGRVSVEGNKAIIKDAAMNDTILLNPADNT